MADQDGSENLKEWSNEPPADLLNIFHERTSSPKTTTPSLYHSSPGVQILKGCTLFIILLVSIAGNVLILATIARDKKLQTKTSVFVGSLAIADLLTAISSFSFMFVTVVYVKWNYHNWYCEFVGALMTIACAASILTLGCIAIDRYHLIIHSLHYETYITTTKVTALLTWTWAQAIIISLLPLTGWSQYQLVPPQHLCTVDWDYSISFSTTVLLSTFCVPLVIMGYCYYHILKTARDQQRRVAVLEVDSNLLFHRVGAMTEQGVSISSSRTSSRAKRFKRETKAAMTILVVIGTFVFCWLPFVVIILVVICGDEETIPDGFYALSSWLICINSACNPIIYGIMNKQYRASFVRYLCCMTSMTLDNVQPARKIETISHAVQMKPEVKEGVDAGRMSVISFDSAIEMDSNVDIKDILPPSVTSSREGCSFNS